MSDQPGRLSRRAFTAAAAGVPLLIARQNSPVYPAHVSESAVQDPLPPDKHPPVPETLPFAEPLVFARKDAGIEARQFPLDRVRLLAGPCREADEQNRAYMLRLGAGRLVHNFRVNAGLPSSAAPLGGWEAPDSEVRGHFAGHYLSACALRSASAGDGELKARSGEMVSELARCQEKLGAGGYLSAFPLEFFERLDRHDRVWAPFYTVHKVMAGLLDLYLHAGNRQALEVVSRMADWADRWGAARTEAHMQEILKAEYGGMSEVLYNLAAAANEPRWARAADRFQKKAFLTPLAQRRDELRHLHVNTHVPQAVGAARRYELSSDPRFRDAAAFFWYAVTSARSYATGGSGNTELWLTDPGPLSLEWQASTHHQECCCAYNMMKLTRHLYSWSGDPRYFDYYERNLFNHRLGCIQPETGHSLYFLSLAPGAWKTLNTEDDTFWCCAGTALEEYSKLSDSIYYQDAEGIRVNLYVASELDARERGVRLRLNTRFPDEASAILTVAATPEAPWTLRLRIPSWTESASVKINGRTLEVTPGGGSYLAISRVWREDDRVELLLPMRLASEAMPDNAALRAFVYGPIVLAGDFGREGLNDALILRRKGPDTGKAPMKVPGLRSGGRNLEEWIKPAGSDPLTFRVAGQNPALTLRPLARLWGRFATYWNVS